jgi:GT2 family glycosyltransferase
MRRVSIIIPAFNQAVLTERCLQTLGTGDFEIIVVDDASTDTTAQMLASFAGGVKVISHSVNQGFATSCNHGAAVAGGEFLVFLNNDTVPQRGWLEALVRHADAYPQAGAIGAKLLYPDKTIQHAGVVICQDRYPRHIYTGFPADHPAVSKSRPFQVVTAACMLVRRSSFGRMSGFDASFRNGFEDVDFCLRLGQAGHQVHYCADSVVEHLESVAPGRFKHAGSNVALYRERWFESVQPDDVKYYLEDGLLQFSYEGTFPIGINVAPQLAVLESDSRQMESEQLLADQARLIADLRRENTRLSLHVVGSLPDSEAARYDRLRRRVQEIAKFRTPRGATVLVVSKGDRALLEIEDRNGWHFPQTTNGIYAGHHPADSFTAIAQLEALRGRGAQYLLFPSTAFWWLEHYQEFDRHLRTYYRVVTDEAEPCIIFELSRTPQERSQASGSAAARIQEPGTLPPVEGRFRGTLEPTTTDQEANDLK